MLAQLEQQIGGAASRFEATGGGGRLELAGGGGGGSGGGGDLHVVTRRHVNYLGLKTDIKPEDRAKKSKPDHHFC